MAVSHEEAARSYYYLASAGLSAAEALEAMPQVARLAEAAAIDMADATDYATDIMTAFGYTVKDLGMINDVLVATITKTNTNLPMLADAMKYVASVAHTAGVSITETAAAIGMLSNAGIKGSMAGTGLRRIITELMAPSDRAKEVMERLGITMEDVNLKTHSLADVIQLLKDRGATSADIMEMFGQRGGTAMLALMNQGVPALKQLEEELRNSQGITEEVAKTQEQTLNKQLQILKNNFNDLAISVGETLVPALNTVVEILLKLADAFNALPSPIKSLITHAIALGSVIMVFAGVAKAASVVAGVLGAGGALAGAASALSGIASAIGAALAAIAGAISLPVVAIAALIAAIVALIFNIGGFRDKVVAALKWVADKLVGFVQMWLKWWLKLHEPVIKAMQAIWNFLSPYVGKLKALFMKIVDGIWSTLKSAVGKVAGVAKEIGTSLWNGIKGGVAKVVDAVKEPLQRAWDYLKSLPGRFKNAALNIGRSIVDGLVRGVRNLAQRLWDYVVKPVHNAVNAIKDFLHISSPSKVFMDIGRNIVEGYAQGLEYARRLKAELPLPVPTVMSTGGVPTAAAPAPTPTGNNINVIINVQSTNATPEEIADAVRRALEREMGEM